MAKSLKINAISEEAEQFTSNVVVRLNGSIACSRQGPDGKLRSCFRTHKSLRCHESVTIHYKVWYTIVMMSFTGIQHKGFKIN